jgi:hypothetical protein
MTPALHPFPVGTAERDRSPTITMVSGFDVLQRSKEPSFGLASGRWRPLRICETSKSSSIVGNDPLGSFRSKNCNHWLTPAFPSDNQPLTEARNGRQQTTSAGRIHDL